MRKTRNLVFLHVVVCLLLLPRGAEGERPKVGVALSGGAAKGIAHIGALKVIEEAGVPVDFVTGVSMGSIVGGLYAAGYTTAELESLVLAIDWDELFTDRIPRRNLAMEHKIWDRRYQISLPIDDRKVQLPSGLIAGQNITRTFARLTTPVQHTRDFRKLPIPFLCLAADIANGEIVVLDSGHLSEALRASMSIPTVFAPIKIGDRLLVDGGLARVLPAEDAKNMGADIVIGVDVGERPRDESELRSIIDMTHQALTLFMTPEIDRQRELCDILIEPDVHDVELYEFGKGRMLIDEGEKAARAVLPQLEQLADSLSRLASPEPPKIRPKIQGFYVIEIAIEGLARVPRELVERELDFELPGRLTISDIEEGVDRVYNTQLFHRVAYGIGPTEGGSRLTLRVSEKTENLFRIGFRYDSHREGMLLLNTTWRDNSSYGATFALDLILSEEWEIDAKYFMHSGILRALGVRARVNTTRRDLDVFEGDQRVATYRTQYSYAEAMLGSIFSSTMNAAIGVRAEYMDQALETGSIEFSDRYDTVVPVFGKITIDSYDRTVFPASGFFLDLSAELADSDLGSDVSFTRYYLDQRLVLPLLRRLSLLQAVYVGTTRGDGAPPGYLFYLGGVDQPVTFLGEDATFLGLKHQERTGEHVQVFQLGVQIEFLPNKFLQVGWNIGNTFHEWNTDLDFDRYINGGGIAVGMDTIVGPITFTMMTSERHDFLTHFSAGYRF
ncbi:MAG: patatin-like phospholipase family protein [Candidatus Latescibacterota bacterium]|nr:MAG: patatin-like phospholipase family protein [Candidatus Latescibacterota bacterium]